MSIEKSLNFIEAIVEKDLAEGVNDGRIQTRFPPDYNRAMSVGSSWTTPRAATAASTPILSATCASVTISK
jgi:hypothetical protein